MPFAFQILLAGFFVLLPLVFNLGYREWAVETPKFYFSALIISALGLLFIYDLIRKTKVQLRCNRGGVLIFFVFICYSLSFLFSRDHYLSLWGEPALPSESYASVFLFFIVSFLVLQYFTDKKSLRLMTNALILLLGLECLLGFLQFVDRSPFQLSRDHLVYGTIGITVGYATLLGCLLPLVYYKIIKHDTWPKLFFYFALVSATTFNMMASASRTPLAATLVTTGVFFLLQWRTNLSRKNLLKIFLIIICGLLPVLYFKAIAPEAIELKTKLRGEQIETALSHRILIWQGALKAWRDNPLIGSGPETFLISQRPYHDVRMNEYEYWSKAWPKAHNHLFQALVCVGILGLFFILYLFFRMARDVYVRAKEKTNHEDSGLADAYFLGFFFLFIANLTCFNFLATQAYSFLFPVLFYAADTRLPARIYDLSKLNRRLLILISTCAALLTVLFMYESVRYFSAQKLILQARKESNINKNDIKAIEIGFQALEFAPEDPFVHCQMANSVANMISNNKKSSGLMPSLKISAENQQKAFDMMTNFIQQCRVYGGDRISFKIDMAHLLGRLYLDGVVAAEPVIAGFNEVLKLNPSAPDTHLYLGIVYRKEKRDEAFEAEMQRSIALKADYIPAYIELLNYYYEIKNQVKINELIEKLLSVRFKNAEFVPLLADLVEISRLQGDQASQRQFEKIRSDKHFLEK